MTLRIIDAHHHLWIPEQSDHQIGYRWLRDIGAPKPFGDPTPIQRDYEWSEFSTESKQIKLAGSVYVQVDGAIGDPVAEVAWVQSVFDTTEAVHGIVGLVDLANDSAEAILDRQMAYPAFRGIRQIIAYLEDRPELRFAPGHYLRNPKWCEQFQLLAERNLSFDLQLYPEQMAEAAAFLTLHPKVPIAVDHAGSPYDQSAAGLAQWQQGMKILAELPQVTVKLSGFGMYDSQRSTESLQPLIDFLLEQFGPQRLMFGSNFPVDRLMGSYDSLLDAVVGALPDDQVVLRAVFHDTAVGFYRL